MCVYAWIYRFAFNINQFKSVINYAAVRRIIGKPNILLTYFILVWSPSALYTTGQVIMFRFSAWTVALVYCSEYINEWASENYRYETA